MAQDKSDLPEGTDKIIPGAMDTGTDDLVVADTTIVKEKPVSAPAGLAERPVTGSGAAEDGLAGKIRTQGEKISQQAGEKARGLVAQGLERSAEALANVGRLVAETAPGLDERLGEDYGDYARRAAKAIDGTANSLATKDPDELIEDTRNFVRNSPGVAIAGAAIVGFALARLLKGGLAPEGDDNA